MYQIAEGAYRLEDGSVYRSYGLITSSGLPVYDITVSRPRLESFVAALNRLDASETHIWELIDDFLADEERHLATG